MSNWEKAYEKWLQTEQLDDAMKEALHQLEGSPEELQHAFKASLTFGKEGMHGIMGPGTNRMNMYTVRRALKGLARYLEENKVNYKDRGVVVAYDARYMSQEFAFECAKVLGYHGIKTYIFHELRPSPLLSFAIRYLGAVAGIMITASHQPSNYNGMKLYNEAGSQLSIKESNTIIHHMSQVEDVFDIPIILEEELLKNNLLEWLNEEIDHAYLEQLLEMSKMEQAERERKKDLKIVYTPLHGTGGVIVPKGLQQINFQYIDCVEEQKAPVPEFRTVFSPDPGEDQAFTRAIKLGEQKNADILLATDPNADRLGVAVKHSAGDYRVLTSNQLGSLLLDYILLRTDPQLLVNARMIKTLVTTELGRAIANQYGVKTIDTLVGFTYIDEKINAFDATGETFVFGYDERDGYLINSFSRDKDGVQAAVVACEMASYWKERGVSLFDRLHQLYEDFGYYLEDEGSMLLEENSEQTTIEEIMRQFDEYNHTAHTHLKIICVENYQSGLRIYPDKNNRVESIHQSGDNVVKYYLEENCWICICLSTTEPKMTWYYGVQGITEEEAMQKLNMLQKELPKLFGQPIV